MQTDEESVSQCLQQHMLMSDDPFEIECSGFGMCPHSLEKNAIAVDLL